MYILVIDNLEVERLMSPTSLIVDDNKLSDTDAYPVTLTVKKLPPPKEFANGDVKSGMYRSNLFAHEEASNGPTTNGYHTEDEETLHCKYVVGCDGARSWVRK